MDIVEWKLYLQLDEESDHKPSHPLLHALLKWQSIQDNIEKRHRQWISLSQTFPSLEVMDNTIIDLYSIITT
jgi:hypothetical protein